MSKLYHGSQDQLEKQLAAEVAAAKKNDPFYPVIVIVENKLTGLYLRGSLAATFGSYCRVRFLTLKEIASELAHDHEEIEHYRSLPFYGEEWLAGMIARQKYPAGYFDPVAESRGFSKVLLQLFRELEENMIDLVPAAEEAEPARIAGLQQLYSKYKKQLAPYCTRETCFKLATRAIPPREACKLIIFGLYKISPLEKELIKRLLQCSMLEPVILWHRGTERFSPQADLLHWYEQSGLCVSDLEISTMKTAVRNNLARLHENCFSRGSLHDSPNDEDDSLAFISAPDELQEVHEITREIINLAGQGCQFRDIAVFVPNAAYAYQCASSFSAVGIPYYRSGGVPLDQTRTGRSILLFLDLVESDFPRRKVLELLAYASFSFYKRLEESNPVSPALWGQLAVQAGIVRGRQQWLSLLRGYKLKLEQHKGEEEPAENRTRQEKISGLESLSDVMKKLFEAADKITAGCSWALFSETAVEIISDMLEEDSERDQVITLLKQLASLDQLGGEVHFKNARSAVNDLLQFSVMPQGRFQRSGVNIITTGSASGAQFEVVFLPGLNESVYPSLLQPDPLIPEAERKNLHDLLPLHSRRFQFEALDYILALGAARKKAVISWARFSATSGRELFPSPFIYQSSLPLLGKRAGLDQLDQLPGYQAIQSVNVSDDPMKAISAEEYDLAVTYLMPDLSKTEAYLRSIDPILSQLISADLTRHSTELTSHQGLFAKEGRAAKIIESDFGCSEKPVAVTAMEDYARCPFVFYLKHLLEITLTEEPEEIFDLPAQDKGLIIHRVLEQFYRQALKEKILPTAKFPGQCRKLLAAVSCDCFDQYQKKSKPYYHALLWRAHRRNLNDLLFTFLEWEINNGPDGLIPAYFEKRIGYPGEPVFKLSLDNNQELFLKGRIDRVDLADRSLRVIDYKTGRKKEKNNDLKGGEALQLPLYLLAVSRILNRLPSEKDSAYYYYFSAQDLKTVVYSGENWSEKEDELKTTVNSIYRSIITGRFFPYPRSNTGSCDNCSYQAICGPDIFRIINFGKAADQNLLEFTRFKEDY